MVAINLNSLPNVSGAAYYTLSGNGTTYTFTGDGHAYTVINFWMDTSANVTLDGQGGTTFNCPVNFYTKNSGDATTQGNGRILNFINTFQFNNPIVVHTFGNNTTHSSVVNLGTNSTLVNLTCQNTQISTNENDVVKLAGLGRFHVLNNSILNIFLNPITGGVHQYAPIGNHPANFDISGNGIIYAVIGSAMQAEDIITLTTYMIMDPLYTLRFDVSMNTELSSIPSNVPIVINSPGVEFNGTNFTNTFNVQINAGCDLTLENDDFNVSGTSGPVFNITGSGTLDFSGGVTIEPNSHGGLIINNEVTLNVNDPAGVNVYLPDNYVYDYSFSEPTAVQNFTFNVDISGSFNFGTFDNPLNIVLADDVNAVVQINANAGINASLGNNSNLEFTRSNIYASQLNHPQHEYNVGGVSLFDNFIGTGSQISFDTCANNMTGIYAGADVDDGNNKFTLVERDNYNGGIAMTGFYRYYLQANGPCNRGSWMFDENGYWEYDLQDVNRLGVYLDTNHGKYDINLNYTDPSNNPFPILASSTTHTPPDSPESLHSVCRVSIGGTIGDASNSAVKYDMSGVTIDLYATFYDSTSYTTPLTILNGNVMAVIECGQQTIFKMANQSTVPYLGYIGCPSKIIIELYTNTYNFDIGTTGNSDWYLSPIYVMDSNSYTISNINSSGILFVATPNTACLTLCSTYQVSIDLSGNTLNLHDGHLSNVDDQGNTVLNIFGEGTLRFSCNVRISVYALGALTNDAVTLECYENHVIVNYYMNSYDFGSYDRTLEYTNEDGGINLKDSSGYVFINTSQRLQMNVGCSVSPIIQGNLYNPITINTTSSSTTYVSNFQYTYESCYCPLIIKGTGIVEFDTNDQLFVATDVNTHMLFLIGLSDDNGSASLLLDTCQVSLTNNGSYRYGIEAYTTGNINTTDFHLCPTDTKVYWPTLANTTITDPYISSHNYVATSYNQCIKQYYQQDNGQIWDSSNNSITEIIYTIASGNISNDTSDVNSHLAVVNYNILSNNYDSDVNTLFTSNTYNDSYFGSYDGTQDMFVDGLNTVARRASFTINISTSCRIYIGDIVVETTFDASGGNYGSIPHARYEIGENVCHTPSLCVYPTTITFNDTEPALTNTLRFHLSKKLILPLYIYPTLDSSGEIVTAANLLLYRDYSNSSMFVSYDQYTDVSTNTGEVQFIGINSYERCFGLRYDASKHEYYEVGAYTQFDLYLMPNATDPAPLFVSDNIYIDNSGNDILYPLISLDGTSIISSYTDSSSASTTIYGTGDVYDPDTETGQAGTFIKHTHYNCSKVTYTLTLYIKSPIYTNDNSNHNIFIQGNYNNANEFTYTFSGSDVTDNGNGTANLVYSGIDISMNEINVTVTTSNDLNTYIYGDTKLVSFSLQDQVLLKTFDGSGIAGEIQIISSYFSMPFTPLIGYGDIDGCNIDNMRLDQGEYDGTFSTGSTETITIMTIGKVAYGSDPFIINFNVSINPNNTDVMPYTADTAISVSQCNYRGTGTFNIGNSNYHIYGNNAYINYNQDTYSINGNLYDSITNDSLHLTDGDDNTHRITFHIGIGIELNDDSTNQDGTTDVQQPSSFGSLSPVTIRPTNKDLFMNVYVNTSSVPYNISNGNDAPIQITYIVYGTDASDGSNLSELTVGDSTNGVLLYDNSNSAGSNNLNTICIDNNDWNNTSDIRFIVLGTNIAYNYIHVKYYVSNIHCTNDYYNLPRDSGNPVEFAIYDFSQSESGSVGARYFLLGDWQLQSNGRGDLIFKYVGTVQNDETPQVGSTFTLVAPTEFTEATINYST